jgi:hypothetical protein
MRRGSFVDDENFVQEEGAETEEGDWEDIDEGSEDDPDDDEGRS